MKYGKMRQKLLFLQLPRLENDTAEGENIPMASRCLFHALERAGLSSSYQCRWLTPEEEELDDRHLLEKILAWQPDIVLATGHRRYHPVSMEHRVHPSPPEACPAKFQLSKDHRRRP